MSAEFASLVRWSEPTRSVVGSSARDTIVDADQENGSTNAVPVRLLLQGLRAQRETLPSSTERFWASSLQMHASFGPSTDDLKDISVRALAEVELLIRHGKTLLGPHPKARP